MKQILVGVLAAAAVASATLTDDQIAAAQTEFCASAMVACPTLYVAVGSIPGSLICGNMAQMYPIKDLTVNATGMGTAGEDFESFFNLDCRFGAIKKQTALKNLLTAVANATFAAQVTAAHCVAISHLGWDVNVAAQVNGLVYQLSQSQAVLAASGGITAQQFQAANAYPACGRRANAVCHMVYTSVSSVPCNKVVGTNNYKNPFLYESLDQCLADMYTVHDDPMGYMASNTAPILSGATTDCRIFYALIAAKANIEQPSNVSYIRQICTQTTWTGGAFCTSAATATVPAPNPCEQFCNSFDATCNYSTSGFTDIASCKTACATWGPDANFNMTLAGVPTATRSTYNSIGCRKYHITAAEASTGSTRDSHCGHAGATASTICNVVPTCNDTAQNGDETGVDCGGSCPDACKPAGGAASGLFPSLAVLLALCAALFRFY